METPRTMITFKTNEARFTYRVAGIAIYNGQVLFQRGDRDPENGRE